MHVDGATVTGAPRAELVWPWTKTKTRRDRSIPISSRLKGILALRGFDPAGQPLPATSYVFGNEIGQRVQLAASCGLQTVFRNASDSMCLSRLRSATTRFSRVCSSSS